MDFDANNLNKQANAIQKEIGAKKKVCTLPFRAQVRVADIGVFKAKENADDLVAEKLKLSNQAEALKKETKEFELRMRAKASGVGNIVGKDVPVSMTEVCRLCPGPVLRSLSGALKGRQRYSADMASGWTQRTSGEEGGHHAAP